MGLSDFFKKKDEKKEKEIPDLLKPKPCPTPISPEITLEIDKISWQGFGTAYGNTRNTIPYYLKNLFCSDLEVAKGAAHQLWCSLCHQHAFISSAALPSYDILKTGLLVLHDDLKFEILDIFVGFAFCMSQEYITKPNELVDWEKELQQKLINDRRLFNELSIHNDEDISRLAQELCSQLDNTKPY
jgi:hypothetical protein